MRKSLLLLTCGLFGCSSLTPDTQATLRREAISILGQVAVQAIADAHTRQEAAAIAQKAAEKAVQQGVPPDAAAKAADKAILATH